MMQERCAKQGAQTLRSDGAKKSYVKLTPDYDTLDVANKIGITRERNLCEAMFGQLTKEDIRKRMEILNLKGIRALSCIFQMEMEAMVNLGSDSNGDNMLHYFRGRKRSMYISLEQHKLRIIDKMEKVRELQHIYIELKWMACTRTSRWLLLLILFRTFERQWSGTEVVGNCTRHCGAFTATSNEIMDMCSYWVPYPEHPSRDLMDMCSYQMPYLKHSSSDLMDMCSCQMPYMEHPSSDKFVNEHIDDEDQALMLLTSLSSSYENFVETLLYRKESLTMEDVLAILNSRELKKRTEGTKEETGDGLYVRGRSDHFQRNQYVVEVGVRIVTEGGGRDWVNRISLIRPLGMLKTSSLIHLVVLSARRDSIDEYSSVLSKVVGYVTRIRKRSVCILWKQSDDFWIQKHWRFKTTSCWIKALGYLNMVGFQKQTWCYNKVGFSNNLGPGVETGLKESFENEDFRVSTIDAAVGSLAVGGKQPDEKTNSSDCL
ncbi:zinc finger, CCHC-type containing protein [Tanacetum coccineum]